MFCSKCGKEIADEAVICPMCGCATANYHAPATPVNPINVNTHSMDYVKIKEFEEGVNGIRGLSIVSLILFLGIGIIFSLIAWSKARALEIPRVNPTNPNEIAMFESAKRNLKSALTRTYIPIFPLLILGGLYFTVPEGGAVFGILIFAAAILVWCLGIKWTKHLTEELK